MFPLLILLLAVVYFRYQTYRLTEKHFVIKKNPRLAVETGQKDGLTIAQISDSHFSFYYAPKRFDKIVSKLNQAKPDIVLFTGDLIENYHYLKKSDCKAISQQLANIQAPKGKFASLGNHDYRSNGVAAVKIMLAEGGFQLLLNESTLVDQLSLTGIDDAQEGTPDYTVQPKSANFSILMVHEPDQVKQLSTLNSFDLILAGHSHGGQIRLPIFTYKNFGSKSYDRGVYPLTATTSLVVNTGLGTTGPPIRFRVIPEILYFHL